MTEIILCPSACSPSKVIFNNNVFDAVNELDVEDCATYEAKSNSNSLQFKVLRTSVPLQVLLEDKIFIFTIRNEQGDVFTTFENY